MNDILKIYKLLSDETRLRVILLLLTESLCVCEICGILQIPQPKVSKSLSKFRDLSLVVDDRKDKFVFYSLAKNNPLFIETLNVILSSINDYPLLNEDQKRLTSKNDYAQRK